MQTLKGQMQTLKGQMQTLKGKTALEPQTGRRA